MSKRAWLSSLALAAAVGVSAFAASSCTSTTPNRNPVGEVFPDVAGQSLEEKPVRIPADFAGEPVVLLVGYIQDAQFDIDRWLIGLTQRKVPVKFVEVPTIDGMVPGMFSGFIDDGMRSGIPSELWAGVVTIYGGDASKIVAMFGNERPRNGRVAFLDREGKIVWFHDRGFSPLQLEELDTLAREFAK